MSTPTHSPETSVVRAANTAPSGFRIPSTPTFSFKAPYNVTSSSSASSSSALPLAPSLKQRRVSLALPSSPRLVPAWSFRDDTGLESHIAETTTSSLTPEKRGKMRKIADTSNEDDEMTLLQEKKQRKKWTTEETAMLVEGCRIHGVGSWKTILSDPNLKFDNRSPVDLKDRFRTYFPDAYQKHYPNARTHLSSKVRSILPDGSSLFEKTRSKKRRPFTEEEDRALKAGYEKHGTVWATIVKDPVFQEQNRRSTDLRDRFRNAFPELYQAAGYKPRNSAKKKLHLDGPKLPIRAATDDQLPLSTGPVRSRRRAHTSQGILRGGTKSVPQSTVCSEDEDSSAGEDEVGSPFKTPQTPILVEKSSASSPVLKKRAPATFSPVIDDDDMVITNELVSDPLLIPDFLPPHPQSENDAQSQTWSSGLDTPVHSQHAWSNATGSPTSSHLSADYLMNSAHSSPYQRRSETMGNLGMIGKSAWGTDDWFSANPRLDPESSGSNSSFVDGGFSPASPFSFHNLNQGVLDRYDLFPTSVPHDFSSEVGVGDSHSTFSDEMFPPSGFRGFTHHSNYAGDLIFGARTHQSQPYHGSTLSFGGSGLGLSGMSQSTGIHPMQLHSSALPGIDEIELTNITLDDHTEPSHDAMEDDTLSASQHKNDPHDSLIMSDRFNLNDIVDLSPESHLTPPGTPLIQSRSNRRTPNSTFNSHYPGTHGRSISVPPCEARTAHPRPSPNHTNSQPIVSDVKTSPFFHTAPLKQGVPDLMQSNAGDSKTITSPSAFSPHLLQPSSNDPWRFSTPNDNCDLPPFLDLHYYGPSNTAYPNGSSSSGQGPLVMDDSSLEANIRQGQALDLALSVASSSATASSSLCPNSAWKALPASLRQHIPQQSPFIGNGVLGNEKNPIGIGGGRPQSGHGHHRGQSAVCPKDLMLRNDNKRKRASWDGAHS